jgi:hypothetical protein
LGGLAGEQACNAANRRRARGAKKGATETSLMRMWTSPCPFPHKSCTSKKLDNPSTNRLHEAVQGCVQALLTILTSPPGPKPKRQHSAQCPWWGCTVFQYSTVAYRLRPALLRTMASIPKQSSMQTRR